MRKLILALALLLAQTAAVRAAKAFPYPMTFTQSDGTQITVRMFGDEDFHWYTDMDGNLLERNGNDFVRLMVDKETYLAQGKATAAKSAARREAIAWKSSLFPHEGSPKAVVILAEYSDTLFTVKDPKASFEQYLNLADGSPVNLGNDEHRNCGSVRQYFEEASYGAYTPQFDVYGPVTLPNPMAYYGGTNSEGSDEKYTQLVADACEAADSLVDFSEYDADGNGSVDLVYVIYAGYGQSTGGDANTIWPKSFSYSSSSTYDGKKLARCGVSNELLMPSADYRINGIGLFCHEFSHCLGMPDFYADFSANNQGMENWSIMDNGEYNNYGYYPTMYTAWEREAFGWDSIPTITEAGQYSLVPEQYKRAVKVENDNNSNDYFVLEHFETTGFNSRVAWGSSSYCPTLEGMLIYHVNYSSSAFSLSSMPNNIKGSPRMTVIPADGLLATSYDDTLTRVEYAQQIAGDIFCNDTTFTQSGGLPNAAWWYTCDDKPLYNINYADGTVYFDFLEKISTDGIDAVAITNEGMQSVYSIDGRYLGTSTEGLPHGIYIVGGKKVAI